MVLERSKGNGPTEDVGGGTDAVTGAVDSREGTDCSPSKVVLQESKREKGMRSYKMPPAREWKKAGGQVVIEGRGRRTKKGRRSRDMGSDH